MKRSAYLLALPLVAMFLLAGCGSSDDSSSDSTAETATTPTEQPATDTGGSGGGKAIALDADPSGALAYTTDTLEAKAGTVNVDFTNDAAIAHDVVFEDSSGAEVGRGDVITGDSESVSFDAKPGKYTYYCSLPGHRAAGMEGTLTVK
ncbi:MAG: hypothetical protein IPK93_12160 [Solirubrobacterales bacterium]|nr:hypothetical protein [Solirubrobacterales bacterium]